MRALEFMSVDPLQLRDLIIIPVLKNIDLYSEAAVNLLLGTAAQESALGTYLVQINGTAKGLYQMEPETYYDIILWLRGHGEFAKLTENYRIPMNADQLIGNHWLATAYARLKYYRYPQPLPDKNDKLGLARYWKRVYNTPLGKGSTVAFLDNLERYVKHALL